MIRSFKQIDATFGSGGGGCDFCGANLKRFWCQYTCDPNQADFVSQSGNITVVDPTNPNNNIEVMNVTI
jgi:hypothetical protein